MNFDMNLFQLVKTYKFFTMNMVFIVFILLFEHFFLHLFDGRKCVFLYVVYAALGSLMFSVVGCFWRMSYVPTRNT